ncbi:hypothetical protein D9758_011437 [Tetrapyrgos nigripes]|uniref:Uncharacterized protein n=1 Tax=Tetrapyrgos nigripes TaxID=182062 RepID=A0A8H5CQC9_9AGAR|nr:hypothetical protein D9758_011437 [Tetrapyrgos nigripes]
MPNCLASHVRKLTLTRTHNASDEAVSESWQELFIHTLSKLINLRSIDWRISRSTPEWMYTQVPLALSKLPSLSTFKLDGDLYSYPASFTLDCLKNLQALAIKGCSPELEIHGPQPRWNELKPTQSLHDLFESVTDVATENHRTLCPKSQDGNRLDNITPSQILDSRRLPELAQERCQE